MYYPDGYDSAADPRVAGAWLVDSFSQFWKSEREWDYYMGRMLRSVWDSTGVVCMAVCAGGSALLRPSGGGLTYVGLAAVLPGGLDWVAPIVCGNDLYKHGAIVQAVDDALLAAVDDFCACAREKACICPDGSSRGNHRQDQAALTLTLATLGMRYIFAATKNHHEKLSL